MWRKKKQFLLTITKGAPTPLPPPYILAQTFFELTYKNWIENKEIISEQVNYDPPPPIPTTN